MNRIQVVDLVRAAAILTVLIHHLGAYGITEPSSFHFLAYLWYKLWVNGGFGVTVFFVVSGFVITRLIASQPGGLFGPNLRDFYSRRFGRIVPLLVLTCLAGLIILWQAPVESRPYQELIKNPKALFTAGFWLSIPSFTFYWYKCGWFSSSQSFGLHWDLLWSLSVEEQFYFFYPFLLKKLGNERNLRFFLVLLIFFPPILNTFHSFYFPHTSIPVLGNLDPFAAIATGCLLYLFHERYKNTLSGDRIQSIFLATLGLALFLKAYFHQDYKADILGHILGGPFLAWGTAVFLLGGLHLELFNSRYFAPFARLGILSYGAYLMHVIVLYFLWPFLAGKNEFLAFFIFAALTFSVAQLSYQFYEVPVNLWVRRVLGRPHAKGA